MLVLKIWCENIQDLHLDKFLLGGYNKGMDLDAFLNMLMEINEKYMSYSRKKVASENFDILHMSIASILSAFTDEQLEAMPEPYVSAMERLERRILAKTSETYKKEYEEFEREMEELEASAEVEEEEHADETANVEAPQEIEKRQIGFVADWG